MNKSACLGDIIDSVQNLEEAVQMDIGVTRMCACVVLHSYVTVLHTQTLHPVPQLIVMSAVPHRA